MPERRRSSDRQPDHRVRRFCEQVRRTLEYALSGELDDDLLRTLYVASVDPAPDAGRLLVTVVPLTGVAPAGGERPDPAAVVTRLHARAGELRSAVARSISRRKVPDLMFRYAENDPAAGEPSRPAAGEEE